jgi:hypothetical protein
MINFPHYNHHNILYLFQPYHIFNYYSYYILFYIHTFIIILFTCSKILNINSKNMSLLETKYKLHNNKIKILFSLNIQIKINLIKIITKKKLIL